MVHSDSGTAVETPTPVASSRLPNRLAAAPPSRLARHETPTARATFDYSYVASDLRRIAIAFGGIVIALIILSFVIH